MFAGFSFMVEIIYITVTALIWLPAQVLGHLWFLFRVGFKQGNKPML